jgi:DNA-binding MarR family transcriptional regulator
VTEPRWLDDREQRAWRAYVQMHVRLIGRLSREMARGTGLSDGDFGVLVNLSEAPDGRLRAFQLGQAMQWEKSRLSHHLSRMERRGLVSREECPTDARGAFIVMTDEGRVAIEAAAPKHVDEVRRFFIDVLTAQELEALVAISDKVLAELDTQADDGGCG